MRALVFGGRGQLGQALSATVPDGVACTVLGSDAVDITDRDAVDARIAGAAPDLIVNAAAYTAVDRAEGEADLAHAVNAAAVATIANAARIAGARLVQVSTDFVFDGLNGTPYRTDAPTRPLGVYGRTKLAGEGAAGDDALIVRTAWLYGPTGHNFVRTMLRLMAGSGPVRVVDDQIGTPTCAVALARTIWALADLDARGIYHVTDSGTASWYDFAVAIQEEAVAIGLLDHAVPIVPVPTAAYPTAAVRPPYSVLDKTETWRALGRAAPHWRSNLRTMLQGISRNG